MTQTNINNCEVLVHGREHYGYLFFGSNMSMMVAHQDHRIPSTWKGTSNARAAAQQPLQKKKAQKRRDWKGGSRLD